MSHLIEIQDLVLRFYTYEGTVKALEGINLFVKKGETLGVVGETGCGKTMTGLSIFNITPSPGKIESGKVLLHKEGTLPINLLSLNDSTLQKIRGKDISMVFQEPSSALNPVYSIYTQISEAFLSHQKKELTKNVLDALEKDMQPRYQCNGCRHNWTSPLETYGVCPECGSNNTSKKHSSMKFFYEFEKKIYGEMLKNPNSLFLKLLSRTPIVNRYQNRLKSELRKASITILKEMEMPDPERVIDMYPHELSGGMQQRVVIAMALACNPVLLTADEPTTSLDVTIQARILDLIKRLKEKFKSSILFITHDMGVIAQMCDRVAVMYAGTICEIADVREIFASPLHPYTKALLRSLPIPGKEFTSIEGTVPNLIEPPTGCRFHPRCSMAMEVCRKISPKIREVKKEHFVSCHLYA